MVVVIKEKLESIMTLGSISENSPLGQALKSITTTNNNSSNDAGIEEASVTSARTESAAAAVVARNKAAVKNVDQPYYLTAAFQKKQPLSHQLQAACCSPSLQGQQQQDNVSPLNDLADQQMAQ